MHCVFLVAIVFVLNVHHRLFADNIKDPDFSYETPYSYQKDLESDTLDPEVWLRQGADPNLTPEPDAPLDYSYNAAVMNKFDCGLVIFSVAVLMLGSPRG